MKFVKQLKRNWPLLLMALPVLLYELLFRYLPIFGLTMAFKNVNVAKGIWGSPWNGLSNFEFLFKTSDAWLMVRNTIAYNVVFIILGMFCAMSLAIIYDLLGKGKLNQLNQSLSLFPTFISWVVGTYFVFSFLSTDKGVFNNIISFFGGESIDWYSEPKWWPIILVICNLWKHLGYDSIIYYSNIKGIDTEIYEAARIDGATWFQQIRYITFPMLKSIVILLAIIKVGSIFATDFGLFYLVPKNSGPLYNVTTTVDTYVYNGLMSGGNLGMTAATGFLQSFIGFILIMVTNGITRKLSPEDSMF